MKKYPKDNEIRRLEVCMLENRWDIAHNKDEYIIM
jgi:hypothetical protein